MASTTTAPSPIRLTYHQKDRQVVIVPENQDLFMMSVDQVPRACQQAAKGYEFGNQFKAMLERLAKWIMERRLKINRAFVTVRDASFLLLLIQKERRFDEKFEDDLSDLDVEIACDDALKLLCLNVMALPHVSKEAYASFLNQQFIWEFVGR